MGAEYAINQHKERSERHDDNVRPMLQSHDVPVGGDIFVFVASTWPSLPRHSFCNNIIEQ